MKRGSVFALAITALALIGSGLIYAIYQADEPSTSREDAPSSKTTGKSDTSQNKDAPLRAGRYASYSNANVTADGYNETIIFFHASWCPECRGFEKAIEASDIPEGIQILKTDYDTSKELRKKYAVTIQSTFVKVDSEGNKVSLWSGYGKDKSVDAILENT